MSARTPAPVDVAGDSLAEAELAELRATFDRLKATVERFEARFGDQDRALAAARVEVETQARVIQELRVELDRLADLPECRRQLPDGTVPVGTEAALRAWMHVAADLGIEARHLREENDRLEREVEDLRSRLTAVERLRPARPLVVADAFAGQRWPGGAR